ncbi:MAG: DNA-directed RNA polymerase subunit omega [Acidobacteria bacterium]|nr:DNA-directed RNA polymerase subunit omega [Acidobacteriota bacterium]
MNTVPAGFDSIFRYIIVVSQRAEQLIHGAKPRMESPHHKPTLVAMDEVNAGLVTWRVLTVEEIEAQRQAMVEQIRAEMGAEAGEAEPAARPLPDVLPTAGAVELVEAAAGGGDEDEHDEEVLRLQELLGIAAVAEAKEAGDEAADEADEAGVAEEAGAADSAEPDVTDEG